MIVVILTLFCLTSCTYTITMVHTQGHATDIVDEVATTSPDISPEVTIPMKAI